MRNTFLRAHEMTREIKKEFVNVDYRAQFGISLSYLLNNKEAETMKVKFEKKGIEFVVELKETDCYLTVFDETISVKPVFIRNMWAYRGTSSKIVDMLFGKKGRIFHVVHDSAEQVEQEIEKRHKEKNEREIEDIKSGKKVIKPRYKDGEYLMGWTVFDHEARLLEELKVAKYVSGWGTHIDNEVIDALGEEFTYKQVLEFIKPRLEAEEAKKAKAKAEIAAKFAEAKETGDPVVIRRWSEPCNDPYEECDVDNLVEYAMPDGTTKVERHHTW